MKLIQLKLGILGEPGGGSKRVLWETEVGDRSEWSIGKMTITRDEDRSGGKYTLVKFSMWEVPILFEDDKYLGLYINDELIWWIARGHLLEG